MPKHSEGTPGASHAPVEPLRIVEGNPATAHSFLNAYHATRPGTSVWPETQEEPVMRDAQGRPLRVWLAERGDRVVGLLAMARDGDVSYAVIAPDPEAEQVAEALLREGESFALTSGAGAVRLYQPAGAVLSAEDWVRLGYRPIAPTVATLRTIDLATLLRALAAGRPDAVAALPRMRIHVHRERGFDPSLDHPDLLIRVGAGGFTVAPAEEPWNADIRIDLRAQVFASLVLGAAPLETVENPRTVRVSPPERTGDVRALIEALRPTELWFTPIGDRR